MKIGFIDHEYHKKTKSSIFFIDLLISYGWDVNLLYVNENIDGFIKITNDQNYNKLIFWQVIPSAKNLLSFETEDIYLIPMYDACSSWNFKKWEKYKKFKFISFSKALNSIFEKLGMDYLYVKYAPKAELLVDNLNSGKKTILTAFVWRRSATLNLPKLFNSLIKLGVEKVFLHDSPDPPALSLEGEISYKNLEIETSYWFNTHSEYLDIIKICDIYIAPRMTEGIGMSFLEAMSLGICVFAPNKPTMNEYIIDGNNGILFENFKDIENKNLNNIERLKTNALKTIYDESMNWQASKEYLFNYFIENLSTNNKSIPAIQILYKDFIIFLTRFKAYMLKYIIKTDY